jgi:hypothetical protein
MIVMAIGLPLGRRRCIILGDLLVLVGASLQASAWSVPQIIIGRVLCVSRFSTTRPPNDCFCTNREIGIWNWGIVLLYLDLIPVLKRP